MIVINFYFYIICFYVLTCYSNKLFLFYIIYTAFYQSYIQCSTEIRVNFSNGIPCGFVQRNSVWFCPTEFRMVMSSGFPCGIVQRSSVKISAASPRKGILPTGNFRERIFSSLTEIFFRGSDI